MFLFFLGFSCAIGGKQTSLQQISIIQALTNLDNKLALSKATIDKLQIAYAFLRNVENRIQMSHDQQNQNIPATSIEQARLTLAMGYQDWPTLKNDLKQQMKTVKHHFARMVASPELDEQHPTPSQLHHDLIALWHQEISAEAAEKTLKEIRFVDTELVLQQLKQLYVCELIVITAKMK